MKRVPGASRKQPLLIRMRDREPFAMAALWTAACSPSGEQMRLATIVTTSANALLAPIHGRMPVILSDDALALWLSHADSPVATDTLHDILRPIQ